MSQMADVITKESVHRLHEAFVEGVLEIPRTKSGDIKLNADTFQAVGEPIVHYIHTRLWNRSHDNNTGKLIDYPKVTDQSINSLLEDEGVSHVRDGRAATLGADVARVMQQSGIALYRRPLWYLKPYDSKRVEWVSTYEKYTKPDPKTEKRIMEEADKPVTSRIDLRSIQRPKEFTPEAVADFIERFIPAALKLQDRYEKLAEVHEALLKEMADKASEDEWKGVASVIEEVLG